MVWGESIGLLSPDEGRDDVLDQAQGRQEIEDVLQQISILLKDAEKLKTNYGVDVDSMNDSQSDRIEVSRSRRDIFKQNPIVDFRKPFCSASAKIYYPYQDPLGNSRLKKV